jgi:hypothetical protein
MILKKQHFKREKFPAVSKKHSNGFWLSFDLLLSFFILLAVLSSILPLLYLSNVYASMRSNYSQRLLYGLSLSQQVYEDLSLPIKSSETGVFSFFAFGHYDSQAEPSSIPAASNWAVFSSTPSLSGPSRICIMRKMVGKQEVASFWVCENK